MSSIREHLDEAVRYLGHVSQDIHAQYALDEVVAALATASEMETRLRAVIDYLECAGDPPCAKGTSASCDECAVRWDCEQLLADLVPDPLVPRLDANPNTKEDT